MAIIDLQRRLAQAGRIRIGQQVVMQNGKTRPAKLDKFRFTSHNKRAIEGVADLYGGTPQPWTDGPTEGQWEVFSDAAEIPVVVPPEEMSFSQFYEEWSGGGCKRRCDGEWDSISERPCVCDPDNRACKIHTRLSVMLANLAGIGLWRLDTSGYYGATELGGSFQIATMLSQSLGRSVLPGLLRLEERVVKRDGKTNKFVVPVLDFSVDMGALALGQIGTPTNTAFAAEVQTGQSGGLKAVPADTVPVPSLAAQLQAVDTPKPRTTRSNAAEPVKRTGLAPKLAAGATDAPEPHPDPMTQPQINKARAMFNGHDIREDADVHAMAGTILGRQIKSLKQIGKAEADTLFGGIDKLGSAVSA